MDFHAQLGMKEWKQEQNQKADAVKKPEHFRLVPDLSDVSPESVLGTVQYERGFQFLCYLQVYIYGLYTCIYLFFPPFFHNPIS